MANAIGVQVVDGTNHLLHHLGRELFLVARKLGGKWTVGDPPMKHLGGETSNIMGNSNQNKRHLDYGYQLQLFQWTDRSEKQKTCVAVNQ